MAKRKTELGLGRGLNALLGDPDLQPPGEGSVTLPISQVEPGLNQPRKRFEPGALDELAESIRTHGIIQPLTVRRLATGGQAGGAFRNSRRHHRGGRPEGDGAGPH